MKVLIAMDSFKGSLSSLKAARAIEEGFKRVDESVELLALPLADGGEGTTEALCMGLDGRMIEVEVSGPLGDRIKAKYAFIEESNTAIMEMAEAAGLNLIEASRRNPLYTSTYGLGEMIQDAMDKGARNFIIGIGGFGAGLRYSF